MKTKFLIFISAILLIVGFSCAPSVDATTRSLRLGMRGSDVKTVQGLLKDQGYLSEPYTDSYFGTKTRAAVKAFQSDNGISSTGVVGPLTATAITTSTTSGGVGFTSGQSSSSISVSFAPFVDQSNFKVAGAWDKIDSEFGDASFPFAGFVLDYGQGAELSKVIFVDGSSYGILSQNTSDSTEEVYSVPEWPVTISLTAGLPGVEWLLASWGSCYLTNNLSGTPPTHITLSLNKNQSKSCTLEYFPRTSVYLDGNGRGKVISNEPAKKDAPWGKINASYPSTFDGKYFRPGMSMSLSATPLPGSVFGCWSAHPSSGSDYCPSTTAVNPITFNSTDGFSNDERVAPSNSTFKAVFFPQKVIVKTQKLAPDHPESGTITETRGSTVMTCDTTCQNKNVTLTYPYKTNDDIVISAQPATGWIRTLFKACFTDPLTGAQIRCKEDTANTGTINFLNLSSEPWDSIGMVTAYNSDSQAEFKPSLKSAKNGAGTGSLSFSSSGGNNADCVLPDCRYYDIGTSVTVTATPDADSYFAGWSGDCYGEGCVLYMDHPSSITAKFELKKKLTWDVSPTGSGSVSVSPAGEDCVTCTASPTGVKCVKDPAPCYMYSPASLSPLTFPSVSLSQSADACYTFYGWGGDCSGTGNCNLTMDRDHSVKANFKVIDPTSQLLFSANNVTANLTLDMMLVADQPVSITKYPGVHYYLTGGTNTATNYMSMTPVIVNGWGYYGTDFYLGCGVYCTQGGKSMKSVYPDVNGDVFDVTGAILNGDNDFSIWDDGLGYGWTDIYLVTQCQ